MKWSELPEVYRHLDLGECEIKISPETNKAYDCLHDRFNWCNSLQGFGFWAMCHLATDDEQLPLIEREWIVSYSVKPFESVFVKGDNNTTQEPDPVNHPAHYGGKDNVYEAIKIIEHFDLGFHLGNVIKYVLRAGKKGDPLTDLKKAAWYLDAKIKQMQLIRYKALNPGFDPNNCTYAESQKFNEWLKENHT